LITFWSKSGCLEWIKSKSKTNAQNLILNEKTLGMAFFLPTKKKTCYLKKFSMCQSDPLPIWKLIESRQLQAKKRPFFIKLSKIAQKKPIAMICNVLVTQIAKLSWYCHEMSKAHLRLFFMALTRIFSFFFFPIYIFLKISYEFTCVIKHITFVMHLWHNCKCVVNCDCFYIVFIAFLDHRYQISKSSKLTILISHHLPHLDQSRTHSADFDEAALYQLVLKHFNGDWEKAKTELSSKNLVLHGSGCTCYSGYKTKQHKCLQKGFTVACNCWNCNNSVQVNPNSFIVNTNLDTITIDIINSQSSKDLKYIATKITWTLKNRKNLTW